MYTIFTLKLAKSGLLYAMENVTIILNQYQNSSVTLFRDNALFKLFNLRTVNL